MNHDMLRALSESPWAVLPSTLQVLTSIATNPTVAKDVAALALPGRSTQPSARNAGSVAVLPLYGLLTHRTWIGWPGQSTSYQAFAGLFQQVLADPSVNAIVIDAATPGGEVAGCQELAELIYNSRGRKRIIACSNTQMASAGYWICSAWDEITITPSGEAGSIGAVIGHESISRAMEMQGRKVTLIASSPYKTELSPWAPLSPEARAYLQSRVDEVGSTFVRAVAKHRGVSVAEVHSNFGQGRMLSASKAVAAKLADRIETLDQTIARVARGGGGSQLGGGATSQLEMEQKRRMQRLAIAGSSKVLASPTLAVASVPVRSPGYFSDSMKFYSPAELGRILGKAYEGDPYELAADHAITVRYVVGTQIAEASGIPPVPPPKVLYGTANPDRRLVHINSSVSRWDQRTTLAHECAHVFQVGWTEAQVLTFTDAFMTHSPTTDMTAREHADRRQEQALRRQYAPAR